MEGETDELVLCEYDTEDEERLAGERRVLRGERVRRWDAVKRLSFFKALSYLQPGPAVLARGATSTT